MKDSLDEFGRTLKSTEETVTEEVQAQWIDIENETKLTSVSRYERPIIIQRFDDEFSFNEHHSQR